MDTLTISLFYGQRRESSAQTKYAHLHLSEHLAMELELGVLCAVGFLLWHAAWAAGVSQWLTQLYGPITERWKIRVQKLGIKFFFPEQLLRATILNNVMET